MTKKTKLLFLISSLDRGGAERQLVELVKGLDKAEFTCVVVTVHGQGSFGSELAGLPGVELWSLGKRGAWDIGRPIWRLLGLARKSGPEVVYAFEEGPSLLGLIVAALRRCRLIWGVRNTLGNAAKMGWRAGIYRWLHRRLARYADQIVYNSYRAEREYVQAGYPVEKGRVISNGFDSRRFHFDGTGRAAIRREWGICEGTLVFAVIGSIKPDKNHRLFLEAAARAADRLGDARFAIVGRMTPEHRILGPYAERLRAEACDRGLAQRLLWVGEQTEVARQLSAIDVLVLPSLREGMPNIVGEAMLCERPCIVTNVGDAALLLGNTGTVVPPGDVAALAAAMVAFVGRPVDALAAEGRACRSRIEGCFAMSRMIERTAAVLVGASDEPTASRKRRGTS